ncbi:Major allergen Asp f 2 [Erysiphe neolycopersici]|uniref:Major allergen Asp f 2 n=1 Tax=Erysiphe neolycopersici TaxID=212602 RepID=A0A420HP04_9PEZI|nr:Major allergen Asp f 2 [Erysiphe neolycopersici]
MLSKLLISLSSQALLVLSNPLYLGGTPLSEDQNSPFLVPYNWQAGFTSDFEIHDSCNATQREQLQDALSETVTVAKHAREHILIMGAESPIYKKYFGKGPTGAVLGWYDKIASSNRKDIIFRCDDPDKKCEANADWAGHHRGKNAPLETVICEPSFLTRLSLQALCSPGFDVVTGKPNKLWALDLIHRLYHVGKIGEGVIKHYTHGQSEALALASSDNYTLAATNTDSLILFANEAYAFDIINPGIGCPKHFDTTSAYEESEHKVLETKLGAGETNSDFHTHADGTIYCH